MKRGRILSWIAIAAGSWALVATLVVSVMHSAYESLLGPVSERLSSLQAMPESQLLRPGDTLVVRVSQPTSRIVPFGPPVEYAAVSTEALTHSPEANVIAWYDAKLLARGWLRVRPLSNWSASWARGRQVVRIGFDLSDTGPRPRGQVEYFVDLSSWQSPPSPMTPSTMRGGPGH